MVPQPLLFSRRKGKDRCPGGQQSEKRGTGKLGQLRWRNDSKKKWSGRPSGTQEGDAIQRHFSRAVGNRQHITPPRNILYPSAPPSVETEFSAHVPNRNVSVSCS